MMSAPRVPPIETSRASYGCPSETTLARYIEQSLSPEEQEAIGAHLASCEACDMAVAMFRSGQRSVRAPDGTITVRESLEAFMRRAKLAQELKEGALVGRFRILRRLGQGAMGVVYAAYDPQLDRNVALKVLLEDRADAEWADATSGGGRLLREARSMARLMHANIVTVFEVGLTNGRLFLAMQLVEGTTLDAWLSAEGGRSVAQVVAVFVDVARAIDAAHRAGVVHRDLKPQNILVANDGTPKVTDFGIADAAPTPELRALEDAPTLQMRIEEAHGLVGTPAYMAPEVLLGAPARPAADQFALAACLHEAFSGKRPFSAQSLADLRALVAREPPRIDAAVPPALRAVLVRALERDPANRYPTMAALADALLEPSKAPEAEPRLRRRRWSFVAAGIVGVVALGVTVRLATRPVKTDVTVATPDPPAQAEPSAPPSVASGEPSAVATAPSAVSTVAASASAPVRDTPRPAPRSSGPRRPPTSPKKSPDDGSDWLGRRK